MESLQTTLEMMEVDSAEDEIDPEFEKELLGESVPENEISSKQTNQQNQDQPSDLDDRIIDMEFETLQSRIGELIRNNVPFGRSGMVASAVTFKNPTPDETAQLKVNAIDLSAFTNTVLEKLDDPSFMGMITISLITDDLYQAGFQIDAY